MRGEKKTQTMRWAMDETYCLQAYMQKGPPSCWKKERKRQEQHWKTTRTADLRVNQTKRKAVTIKEVKSQRKQNIREAVKKKKGKAAQKSFDFSCQELMRKWLGLLKLLALRTFIFPSRYSRRLAMHFPYHAHIIFVQAYPLLTSWATAPASLPPAQAETAYQCDVDGRSGVALPYPAAETADQWWHAPAPAAPRKGCWRCYRADRSVARIG